KLAINQLVIDGVRHLQELIGSDLEFGNGGGHGGIVPRLCDPPTLKTGSLGIGVRERAVVLEPLHSYHFLNELQLETERGGNRCQVGELDVFTLLDVADRCLIGYSSSFGQGIPSKPACFACLPNF